MADTHHLLERLMAETERRPDDFFIHLQGGDLTCKQFLLKTGIMVAFF